MPATSWRYLVPLLVRSLAGVPAYAQDAASGNRAPLVLELRSAVLRDRILGRWVRNQFSRDARFSSATASARACLPGVCLAARRSAW